MNLIEQFKAVLKAQGVADEAIDKVVKAMPGAKVYLSSEEHIDERYQKLKGQKELLDEQLRTANGTIDTLKKDNGSNDELQKKVKEHEDTIKAMDKKYKEDVVNVEKKALLIKALEKEGALHADLLVATMDLGKVELKDGKITGHKDAIKSLKETYADQFKVEKDPEDPEPGGNGGNPYQYTPPAGGDKGGDPADIFAAMEEYSVHK